MLSGASPPNVTLIEERHGERGKDRQAMDSMIRYQMAKARIAELQAEATDQRLASSAARRQGRRLSLGGFRSGLRCGGRIGWLANGLSRALIRLAVASPRRISVMRSGSAQVR